MKEGNVAKSLVRYREVRLGGNEVCFFNRDDALTEHATAASLAMGFLREMLAVFSS